MRTRAYTHKNDRTCQKWSLIVVSRIVSSAASLIYDKFVLSAGRVALRRRLSLRPSSSFSPRCASQRGVVVVMSCPSQLCADPALPVLRAHHVHGRCVLFLQLRAFRLPLLLAVKWSWPEKGPETAINGSVHSRWRQHVAVWFLYPHLFLSSCLCSGALPTSRVGSKSDLVCRLFLSFMPRPSGSGPAVLSLLVLFPSSVLVLITATG